MIYFTTPRDGAVVIVEPTELENMLKGKPIRSPDNQLLICYTPDMAWTEKEFTAMLAVNANHVDAEAFDSIVRLGLYRERVYRKVIL